MIFFKRLMPFIILWEDELVYSSVTCTSVHIRVYMYHLNYLLNNIIMLASHNITNLTAAIC